MISGISTRSLGSRVGRYDVGVYMQIGGVEATEEGPKGRETEPRKPATPLGGREESVTSWMEMKL